MKTAIILILYNKNQYTPSSKLVERGDIYLRRWKLDVEC